jgi:prepilin-type N-terminal cleavage/methylation domain-containing protein
MNSLDWVMLEIKLPRVIMKSNQKGFSLPEILIALVVVGLLGVIGWLVYDQQNNKTNEQHSVVQKSAEKKTDNSTSTEAIPDGFTRYQNKEFGFSFNYPSEWGSVVPASPPNLEELLFSGTFDKRTFDNQEDISFAIAPKDYVLKEAGGDSPCYINGFSTFAYFELTNNGYGYTKELVRATNKHVIEAYNSGYCPGGMLAGRVGLNLEKSNGIDITYFKHPEPQYHVSESISVEEFMKTHAIAEKQRADFLKVIDSIKQL